jgi:hypothetical protein
MRDLVVDALATFRLVRLWTADSYPPVKAAREKVEQVVEREHGAAWADGVGCPWCVSVWIAGGVIAARRVTPRGWDVLARALAFSAVAGFLSGDERG